MATSFQVTFDSADPDKLSAFWAAALGYIEQPPPEGYGDWDTFLTEHGMADVIGTASAIVAPDGAGPRVYFQKVPEPKTAKNRMHLACTWTSTCRTHSMWARRKDANAWMWKHSAWLDWARRKSARSTSTTSTGSS